MTLISKTSISILQGEKKIVLMNITSGKKVIIFSRRIKTKKTVEKLTFLQFLEDETSAMIVFLELSVFMRMPRRKYQSPSLLEFIVSDPNHEV